MNYVALAKAAPLKQIPKLETLGHHRVSQSVTNHSLVATEYPSTEIWTQVRVPKQPPCGSRDLNCILSKGTAATWQLER